MRRADGTSVNPEQRFLIKVISYTDRIPFRSHTLPAVTPSKEQQEMSRIRTRIGRPNFSSTQKGVVSSDEKQPSEKKGDRTKYSKKMSTTLVNQSINLLPKPFHFGGARKGVKMAGFIIELIPENAITRQCYIYDTNTKSRPWKRENKEKVELYYHQNVQHPHDRKIFENIEDFEKQISKPEYQNYYNEVLAELNFRADPSCKIGIFSDTLESRLIAQDYARQMKNRLKQRAQENRVKFDEGYVIPIVFYDPNNESKPFSEYTLEQQQADQGEALRILVNQNLRNEKFKANKPEFLLGVEVGEIYNTLKPEEVLEYCLNAGCPQVLESLFEKELGSYKNRQYVTDAMRANADLKWEDKVRVALLAGCELLCAMLIPILKDSQKNALIYTFFNQSGTLQDVRPFEILLNLDWQLSEKALDLFLVWAFREKQPKLVERIYEKQRMNVDPIFLHLLNENFEKFKNEISKRPDVLKIKNLLAFTTVFGNARFVEHLLAQGVGHKGGVTLTHPVVIATKLRFNRILNSFYEKTDFLDQMTEDDRSKFIIEYFFCCADGDISQSVLEKFIQKKYPLDKILFYIIEKKDSIYKDLNYTGILKAVIDELLKIEDPTAKEIVTKTFGDALLQLAVAFNDVQQVSCLLERKVEITSSEIVLATMNIVMKKPNLSNKLLPTLFNYFKEVFINDMALLHRLLSHACALAGPDKKPISDLILPFLEEGVLSEYLRWCFSGKGPEFDQNATNKQAWFKMLRLLFNQFPALRNIEIREDFSIFQAIASFGPEYTQALIYGEHTPKIENWDLAYSTAGVKDEELPIALAVSKLDTGFLAYLLSPLMEYSIIRMGLLKLPVLEQICKLLALSQSVETLQEQLVFQMLTNGLKNLKHNRWFPDLLKAFVSFYRSTDTKTRRAVVMRFLEYLLSSMSESDNFFKDFLKMNINGKYALDFVLIDLKDEEIAALFTEYGADFEKCTETASLPNDSPIKQLQRIAAEKAVKKKLAAQMDAMQSLFSYSSYINGDAAGDINQLLQGMNTLLGKLDNDSSGQMGFDYLKRLITENKQEVLEAQLSKIFLDGKGGVALFRHAMLEKKQDIALFLYRNTQLKIPTQLSVSEINELARQNNCEKFLTEIKQKQCSILQKQFYNLVFPIASGAQLDSQSVKNLYEELGGLGFITDEFFATVIVGLVVAQPYLVDNIERYIEYIKKYENYSICSGEIDELKCDLLNFLLSNNSNRTKVFLSSNACLSIVKERITREKVKNPLVLSMLLKAGFDLSYQDKDGNNLLMMIVSSCMRENSAGVTAEYQNLIDWLIDQGVDRKHKNARGGTVIDLMLKAKCKESLIDSLLGTKEQKTNFSKEEIAAYYKNAASEYQSKHTEKRFSKKAYLIFFRWMEKNHADLLCDYVKGVLSEEITPKQTKRKKAAAEQDAGTVSSDSSGPGDKTPKAATKKRKSDADQADENGEKPKRAKASGAKKSAAKAEVSAPAAPATASVSEKGVSQPPNSETKQDEDSVKPKRAKTPPAIPKASATKAGFFKKPSSISATLDGSTGLRLSK